jgi:hypothetical protein
VLGAAGIRRDGALGALTARELLALMAEGHSNTAIAWRLVLSASAVEKHIGSIFAKRVLPPDDIRHRRVFAVSPPSGPDGDAAAPRTASSSDSGGYSYLYPQLSGAP